MSEKCQTRKFQMAVVGYVALDKISPFFVRSCRRPVWHGDLRDRL
jgi:hypothetical protein